jgi:hypothetical protein
MTTFIGLVRPPCGRTERNLRRFCRRNGFSFDITRITDIGEDRVYVIAKVIVHGKIALAQFVESGCSITKKFKEAIASL